MAQPQAMRYFVNASAAKPVVVGGHSFVFELVGLRGGSWLGILAVDEPAASILAGALSSTLSEINFERYESLKKKSSANQGTSPAWPKQTSTNPSLAVADHAGHLMSQGASTKPVDHNSTASITAVSLLTTTNKPPVDAILISGGRMRRPF